MPLLLYEILHFNSLASIGDKDTSACAWHPFLQSRFFFKSCSGSAFVLQIP